MTKITSKGQFWLPVEIKEFLDVSDGDFIYFVLDKINKSVWLSNVNRGTTNNESSRLSRNQITIPLKIRNELRVTADDTIIFDYDDSKENVYFKKKLDTLTCPVCNGKGSKEHTCIVCRDKGVVEKEFVMDEIAKVLRIGRKYGVAFVLSSTEFNEDIVFPKISVRGKSYPQELLDKFEDYYQLKIIEDFAPKSISNPDKLMNPTDVQLDEILSLLRTKEAKDTVFSWFRYERNVFNKDE
ncbi:Uncharacterised protein [Lysinibacillus capsici]|uniref:SpoVT-AbrB domain-containing protein n=1 Tax=Lysinibacillus capsici TaxID=2115968 RepID=A0A2X1AQK0_9BACI|nr:zinc finger-like domain-containing protein [Lysinibacillus capsici]SPU40724.1 Uncharacterised protein [Lysinibacillus capsici]